MGGSSGRDHWGGWSCPALRVPRVSGIVRLQPRGAVRSSPSIRAQGDFLVVNSSDQLDAVLLIGLRPGATLRDFRRWASNPQDSPSPLVLDRLEVSTNLSPLTALCGTSPCLVDGMW